MQVRKALPEEYDDIFRMGFDAWGEGQSLEVYLAGCRQSPKYQRGCWYVLADDEDRICSSLIRYALAPGVCGIGSIATPPRLRNKGYASELISDALKLFESEGFKVAFLFSDIESRFYERFGFVVLPKRHQHYKDSVCMVRGMDVDAIERDASFLAPQYF